MVSISVMQGMGGSCLEFFPRELTREVDIRVPSTRKTIVLTGTRQHEVVCFICYRLANLESLLAV